MMMTNTALAKNKVAIFGRKFYLLLLSVLLLGQDNKISSQRRHVGSVQNTLNISEKKTDKKAQLTQRERTTAEHV